jgi:hypothetical protein
MRARPLLLPDQPPEITDAVRDAAYAKLVATALGEQGTEAQQQAARRAIATLVDLTRWCADDAA